MQIEAMLVERDRAARKIGGAKKKIEMPLQGFACPNPTPFQRPIVAKRESSKNFVALWMLATRCAKQRTEIARGQKSQPQFGEPLTRMRPRFLLAFRHQADEKEARARRLAAPIERLRMRRRVRGEDNRR
jgi:hypothetical protein